MKLKNVSLQHKTSFDRAFLKLPKTMAGQVENVNCNNPVCFWNAIEKLQPKVKNQIPREVYDEMQ